MKADSLDGSHSKFVKKVGTKIGYVFTNTPKSRVLLWDRLFSTRSTPGSGPLSQQVAFTSEYGLYAFLTRVVSMGFAFLTSLVPDPSFPCASLPESLRLSYTQPRIGGAWFATDPGVKR